MLQIKQATKMAVDELIEKAAQLVSDKKNHTMIEGYIDSYLVSYFYDRYIYKYNN